MIKLRVIHTISIAVILVIFVISILLILVANYPLFAAVIFTTMNIIGATFPPISGLIDAHNPLVLTSVALGAIANVAFTITFTTIFYQILINTDLRSTFMKQRIRALSKQVIITPINGMGIELATKLKAAKIPAVFIDDNKHNVRRAMHDGFMAMLGNSNDPGTLEAAHIDAAIAFYALYDDDIKNTFATIEARRTGRNVKVISRIKRLEDIPKIERSGAKRVILPEAAVGIEISDFLISNT